MALIKGSTLKEGTTPSSSSINLAPSVLAEIQRKAKAGIPLTHPDPYKQKIYDSFAIQAGNVAGGGVGGGTRGETATPISTTTTTTTNNNNQQQPTTTTPTTTTTNAAEDYINQLTTARLNEQLALLAKGKEQMISNLNSEKSGIQPHYYDQRNVLAAQKAQSSRNFAEFMANRGSTNAGSSAQADLMSNVAHQGNLGTLGRQETQAYSDIAEKVMY